jgi:hypothetical protein
MTQPSLLTPQLEGRLLPRFFLDRGLAATPEWAALGNSVVAAFRSHAERLVQAIQAHAGPNEAETRTGVIHPVIEALGWSLLPEQRGARPSDVADALLYPSAGSRDEAARHPQGSAGRYRSACVVSEHKGWRVPLDRASESGTPAGQMRRYLRAAAERTDSALQWGILTNGRIWQLHYGGPGTAGGQHVEADLSAILAPEGDAALRGFLLLFGPGAHALDAAGNSFLARALGESRRYQTRITETLSGRVFDTVFPALVAAVGAGDPKAAPDDAAWRAEAREAALILLYRCLFVLYAEDRGLLPVRDRRYADVALRALREDAGKARSGERIIGSRGSVWWQRLRDLFHAIDAGDRDLGLPPYNGGLFKDTALLARLTLTNRALSDLIGALSFDEGALVPQWINYHDLSVQHLGTIYERLLEQEVVAAPGGGVALRPSAFARKTSGSYYTPEELVALVIRRAVEPLLEEKRAAFRARAAALRSDTRPVRDRLRLLAAEDPASAFLTLRICDPAMGSGHFLVSLVDHLAEATQRAMADAAAEVAWGDYASPLGVRIAAMRDGIRDRARMGGWAVDEARLDDESLIRRIILKRCVFGVDLNPMAVELAKLSLWLHSFTVGAPLSFLDHHLRCGDSLFGEFVRPVLDELRDRYGLVPPGDVLSQATMAAGAMASIEALSDSDMREVGESRSFFDSMEESTRRLHRFLDLWQADRWLDTGDAVNRVARGNALSGAYGDPILLANQEIEARAPGKEAPDIPVRRGKPIPAAEAFRVARQFLGSAGALTMERRFLHWELAFPNVWSGWHSSAAEGGFDAIIGNPPWDRMKLQEVEWFAARVPAIAHAARASDRKKGIERLREAGDPIVAAYDSAAWSAEAAARVARDGGAYPLLGGGDVNLYSLFVERALRLVQPRGMVGLLVPSGIAADKGAAAFFGTMSTAGRLAAFLDFENRRTRHALEPFFPDVDSRFKFGVLAIGGAARRFAKTAFAFFQQDATAAEHDAYGLSPRAMACLNPNTRTAPVFRTRRDAALALRVHRRLPVLVRQGPPRRAAWPLRYATMFHMTNDSDKFVTAAELERRGAYRAKGENGWRRGEERWVPLLVGRSIHQFDHRYASVTENTENLHNPFGSEPTTAHQHADPQFNPAPRFWVSADTVSFPAGLEWAIGFRDIARPTDARTMIASLVPFAGAGNKLPLLLPALRGTKSSLDKPTAHDHTRIVRGYKLWAPLLLANLNAFVFDYIARQKVHGSSLNFYIVEQLPVVPRASLSRRFGGQRADRIIRDHVLRLTYTAHDMAPYARDQGHAGPPFRWDEEERLRLRARLDAMFFLLYGMDREDAAHVLGTFPIVREQEVERYARFRSREIILGHMAAFEAGDTTTDIDA